MKTKHSEANLSMKTTVDLENITGETVVKVVFENIGIGFKASFTLLWISSTILKSIHGMSRIVKLIPDKLATAIAINKENLSDPQDDGSFLVDLVHKLLAFYQEEIDKSPKYHDEIHVSESVQELFPLAGFTRDELANATTTTLAQLLVRKSWLKRLLPPTRKKSQSSLKINFLTKI